MAAGGQLTDREFYELVRRVREAQQRYFRGAKTGQEALSALRTARAYEDRLDREIQARDRATIRGLFDDQDPDKDLKPERRGGW